MGEESVISFELLGSFFQTQREAGKVGKKTCSLLQYLIVNHMRNVSAEELIEVFWAENNSSNPANALRNMLYKIRALLKNMFPEHDNLLQTLQGCYAWDPKVCLKLDTEQFERLCLEARSCPKEQRLLLLKQASDIYKGDFLLGNDSEWTEVPRQYYRTLYLDSCKLLLPLLEEKEQWMEIISICSQAYQIDFCMEEFTAYHLRALIAIGQPEQAVRRYESFRKQIMREMEMIPTERIEQIYNLALGLQKSQLDDQEIFNLACGSNIEKGAFLCSFGVFQSVVALERRHLARSSQHSTLVIVRLDSTSIPNADTRKLERILLGALRNGDPVARLNAGAYIVMLTGADEVGAQIVTGRIDGAFCKACRNAAVQLSFRFAALNPAGEKIQSVQKEKNK